MSDKHSFVSRGRLLVVLLLLCAMLLSGCGSIVEGLLGPRGEESAPPAADEPAPTAAAEIEPTPEPTPEPYRTTVILSELQAANKATVTDADGEFSDWLELCNPAAEAADISGCWLSDDASELCKWQLGAVTLQSGEYLRVFASGKDRREEELHTNFALSRKGDALYFSSPEGVLLWEESYEECPKDCSICFDGSETRVSAYPTPGYPNDEAGYEAFAAANDTHGALVVNEAVTYNDDFWYHSGDYYDWVELKNVSSAAISLEEYYVSDSADEPMKFQLPAAVLAPGATYVVYCGKAAIATSACHAPFKLDSAGDEFYISRADGSFSDYISLHNIPLNCSKGRMDGQSGFFLFSKRTPAAPNAQGTRYASARPVSVTAPGVHDEESVLDVELAAAGTIYYTTDGSEPTTASLRYTGPIRLDKTTTIRAVSAESGRIPSEVETFTYLLGEHHTLPVVCVALDPVKLNILYYNNGNMKYDSHTEYYGPEGSFAQDCMITLHGAASKSAWDKKSFKVTFRDRNGGDIHFDLFGNGITEFHSLNLRGGDTVYMKTYREPLAAAFADRVAVTEPYALDSRFCVLYVNGNYRGIYSLREAYSNKYIESHTGSPEELNTISRAPIKPEVQPKLFELHNFIISCDITDPENYNYIADRIDMVSFAQWLLLETYFNNRDTAGNIRYFKGVQPDGKWRTMFFDLDISMENQNAYIWEIVNPGESQIGRMYHNLLRSPEFKQVLLETASGLYKNGLGYELALEILNDMVEELEPEMERNLARWGESPYMTQANLERQRNAFVPSRDQSWLQIVQSITGASDAAMQEYFPAR